MDEDSFYLRVVTDKVTIRLPCLSITDIDDTVVFIYNWVTLETDVVIENYQAFVTFDDTNYELNDATYLHPDDDMYNMEATEDGVFIIKVPLVIVRNVIPDWPVEHS